MANWFCERPAKVIPAGSIIENPYKPRDNIEESWFEGVTNEVSLLEVEREIGNMGAPGPSGVPTDIMAPLKWRIFWDTLLCIIKDETIGYNLKVQEIRSLEAGGLEGDSLEVSVTAAAFVDDSNTATETREDFTQQMQIFYNTVESNMSKMAIIAVNAPNALQTMKWPYGDDIKTPRDKTITDKTAIYILNRVLLPKVLYMVKKLAITRAQMDL
ncbi:hypothetical protein HDU98_005128, partial [Podochytrium sp. JEL0797]